MVLENLYPLALVKRSPIFALLLGLGYGIVGIGGAVILFPEDPAIVAVAFTAILAIPTIRGLLRDAEAIESERERSSVTLFFKDHTPVFLAYYFLFLGVFIAFSFFALSLPNLATNHIFENQVQVRYGQATGHAFSQVLSSQTFKTILFNNISVLLLCIITAFLIGDGATFLIVWNASVWGTIFGILAKSAAFNVGKDPLLYFIIVIVSVFPHMTLEVLSYIVGATSGGILSKGFIREKFFSDKFFFILRDVIILLIIAGIILFLGAFVETEALQGFKAYIQIIRQSFY
ncbi:stage II sporulation protein M [Candidatus Woesearchaeota archaeon]|nr:stage II sporulation protein M [Candidatus Woesearchaeota archaeon]